MIQTLLTGIEVAKILNISRSQAFTLMQRGDIPTIRIGLKNVRVRMEDLEQYVEDNRFASGQPNQNIEPAVAAAGSVRQITPKQGVTHAR